jgi:predicted nucleotidyltransferase
MKKSTENPLSILAAETGKRWPQLFSGQKRAEKKIVEIQAAVFMEYPDFPPEADLVVCGSIGRGEFTASSDIDWFLLVNGPVKNTHLKLAQELVSLFDRLGIAKPGKGGAFGKLVFSHQLVHVIGGHDDTNNNMTQRLLLLLESRSLIHPMVWEYVLRAILERYLEEETHFKPDDGKYHSVPRFFVNDVVRYWRTICVDYASKHRAEAGEKWVLRNTKLRFSRKLLFVTGLLLAFECEFNKPKKIRGVDLFEGPYKVPNSPIYIEHMLSSIRYWTPLELLAKVCKEQSLDKKSIDLIFGSYNAFLSRIDKPDIRKKFTKMTFSEALEDSDYNWLRARSHEFQEGLDRLFFGQRKCNKNLRELTLKFGIF